ncbi:hypothetical protein EK21DRAFT_57434 [Setomelanomma holmii]|uniref:PHD-type domain-containing protein n=1 Tax=Setomelanomma holmii TaxID=210430 RepID=A0A9P4HFJ2_9PLEO|nr:hypothetical protein EK21DRAFT_57434 [Setomelanomma holmii]
MTLDQHIYGSTDWHLPSPSSTPKSVTFPGATLKTPETEAFPQSHFLDAWSTPRINGQQTPVQTPSLLLSTPNDRPSSSYSLKPRTPEDPEFHVNHFVPNNLPLPPVDVSRRLSSSPGPNSVGRPQGHPVRSQAGRPRPVTMDFSQIQTPPPTRDANSRRGLQQSAGNDFATPATVIQRTPNQMPTADALFNQTPFGFTDVPFSPSMMPFSNTGPMSAPPMPHSRLFWDQLNDGSQMEVDLPLGVDPFGPTPHKVEQNFDWQSFSTPANHQMNSQAFQALHGMSSPGPVTSFHTNNIMAPQSSRPGSFASTSAGVDPNMLFSFSSPGVNTSFGTMPQQPTRNVLSRQPYETQVRDAQKEKEVAKKARSQHSRSNTNSSSGSVENVRPNLQRSNTDSGFRKNRPSSIESRTSLPHAASTIPRRSSPLKRQSGGSLTSIPEIRRPRTRLIIDETGRARTETAPAEDEEETPKVSQRTSQKDVRKQYPGLWDEDETESEDDEPPPTISRHTSFNIPQPQRRAFKHARQDSGGLERSNSFKIARPASRPTSTAFDKASFETARPVRRVADNEHRRFSMMDLPTSFDGVRDEDQHMPDSPGDALGALKKVVAGRQQRADRASQNTLKAHNQRWAQASADMVNTSTPRGHGHYDPFTNTFNASPNTDGLTTPSTDRSSLSSESTRCVCNGVDDGQPMVQCESCNKWLHMNCVGLHSNNIPPVYVCIFCTGQTPIARGGRVRGPIALDSPLTHKSMYRR